MMVDNPVDPEGTYRPKSAAIPKFYTKKGSIPQAAGCQQRVL